MFESGIKGEQVYCLVFMIIKSVHSKSGSAVEHVYYLVLSCLILSCLVLSSLYDYTVSSR